MEENKNNEAVETTEATPVTQAPEVEDTIVTPDSPKTNKKSMVIGIVVALVLMIGVYLFIQSGGSPEFMEEANSGFIDEDLEVARVNGVSIDGKTLNVQMTRVMQVSALGSMDDISETDRAILRSQSLDAVINSELIVQVAKQQGITATDEDVEAEYATIVESIGGEEAATARLAQLNTTEEEFKVSLVNDILIKQYIESITDETALEVTEEDVINLYDEIVDSQGEGVPPLEDIRAQLEAQISFEKQQEALLTMLQELRDNSKVEILI